MIVYKSSLAMKPPGDYSARRDANAARMKAFRSVIGQKKKALFDSVYGENQLNLMVLATRPEYQRFGIGSALVEWGKQRAREQGLTVTLFSSPQGLGLYQKQGFVEVGRAFVQIEGEQECLDMPMMVFRPLQDE